MARFYLGTNLSRMLSRLSNANTSEKAYLLLEDGSLFEGLSFGAKSSSYGEVVFNNSMTGYQEMLTDPSYSGQIVMPTYPLIGNYGINDGDSESSHIQVAGFVVREHCVFPNHGLSTKSINDFLAEQEVVGICQVDTRAIARRLRTKGVMMGIISTEANSKEIAKQLADVPSYGRIDFVQRVSAADTYEWDKSGNSGTQSKGLILVTDCGLKYNILRLLKSRGYDVMVVPAGFSGQEILDLKPNGVIFSPGPGDPSLLDYFVEQLKVVAGKVPIMGICLGHQLIARAFGARTFKLKFGHRGANHPVMDVETGRVYITAQNHGYAVDPDSLSSDLEVSHTSLNDGTIEGLRHKSLPIITVQYHSEASPGPRDNEYLFDRFIDMVK